MSVHIYTREEVLAAKDEKWPQKGIPCPHCHTLIPTFKDLTSEAEAKLKELISNHRSIEAMKEIKDLTDCNAAWAKIWCLHPYGSCREQQPPTPCPYCGEPLRTKAAKQCRHCKKDWHDPNNVISLHSQVI